MKNLCWLALACTGWLQGEVTLAPVFTDHMVLQRDQALPVWGRSVPVARVQVDFGGQAVAATANREGRWLVRLPPQPASAVPRTLRVSASDGSVVAITDVLVGEVWICAGQSNMEWPLAKEAHAPAELPRAVHPSIRFYNPDYAGKGAGGSPFSPATMARLTPAGFFQGKWETCTPASAASMSAIGYYFSRDLEQALGVPVGVIHLGVGGSPAEAWVRREILAGDATLCRVVAGDWLENTALEYWCRQRGRENLAQAISSRAGAPAVGDEGGPNHAFKPGFLWSAGIEPLLPLAVRGVLWYQGESNSLSLARVRQHEAIFPLLVTDWRERWGRPDLPFLCCQLSGIEANPYHSEFWPEFRDSQRRLTDAIPATCLVVTADVGDRMSVHPLDKATVADRLLRVALARTYGRDLEFSGPRPGSWRVEGNELVVVFSHAEGLGTRDHQELREFEVAGADGLFHPAAARLVGATVRVASPDVPGPRRVRYAWRPFSLGNLVNSAGLPTSTFALSVGEIPRGPD